MNARRLAVELAEVDVRVVAIGSLGDLSALLFG
jgi:hypothetical protein